MTSKYLIEYTQTFYNLEKIKPARSLPKIVINEEWNETNILGYFSLYVNPRGMCNRQVCKIFIGKSF